MTTNNQQPKRRPRYFRRFRRLAERVARQSGRRQRVNASRLWNLADALPNPERLFSELAAVVPAAFAEPGNVNSIRFAYWPSAKPSPPALPVLASRGATRCGFDCPRTCPAFERVDVCRFSALLAAGGVRGVVSSETVTVDVAFRNVDALGAAVVALGGDVLGVGSHELFEREPVTGFGFRLPGWRYPLVATDAGRLSFDDYNGRWGRVSDIDKLRAEYSMKAAELAAAGLGWQSERVDVNGSAALRVFHPDGGFLYVSGDTIDANGFNGIGCHDAAGQLAAALGDVATIHNKPERANVLATQQQRENR